jgi:hypothetical protein
LKGLAKKFSKLFDMTCPGRKAGFDTPQHKLMQDILNEDISPGSHILLNKILWGLGHRRTTLEFEYLRESEYKYEKFMVRLRGPYDVDS